MERGRGAPRLAGPDGDDQGADHPASANGVCEHPLPPPVVPTKGGIRGASKRPVVPVVAIMAAVVGLIAGVQVGTGLGLVLAAVLGVASFSAARVAISRRQLRQLTDGPDLVSMACAVADALHATELTSIGSDGVRVTPDPSGTYRIELVSAKARDSELFADAFDELVSPIGDPRYLIPRYVVAASGAGAAVRLASGADLDNAAVYHAVPAALGGEP